MERLNRLGKCLFVDAVFHFQIHKGQTPPAEPFTSIAMYKADNFLLENPNNRYNLAPPLKYNEDGSLDLDSPFNSEEAS
jgi:hypothetical protein